MVAWMVFGEDRDIVRAECVFRGFELLVKEK